MRRSEAACAFAAYSLCRQGASRNFDLAASPKSAIAMGNYHHALEARVERRVGSKMNLTHPESGASAYPRVVKLDVSIGSKNVGDEIIADAVEKVIFEISPQCHLIRLPTHLPLGFPGLKIVRKSKLTFVGGSNLLSSNMMKYNQWKINLIDSMVMKNTVLLGVGWWQYQSTPDFYTKKLLRRVLSLDAPHIVRDNYSKNMLNSLGICNVRNLGCPTTWYIDADRVESSRDALCDSVVTTVTDYKPNPARDNAMLDVLRRNYKSRYIWLQGSEDYRYAATDLNLTGFEIIPPSLAHYDKLLSTNVEYVGTRLHAGIRAMQHGRYSRIVPVDNRATEMGKDFAIPLITFDNNEDLEIKLRARQAIKLRLPYEQIAAWKAEMRTLL